MFADFASFDKPGLSKGIEGFKHVLADVVDGIS